MSKRCKWCGEFVKKDTEPTTRTLNVAAYPRRAVQQLLCPQHASDWSQDSDWNEPPDWSLPLEVLR